ncbi:MAG: sensor domain-containing diguanylate cyclase, partial [Pyrinomonadaceae bacterium]
MLSLYGALLAQHPRQLTPVRCAEQTIAQLQRYFEDVVLENNLSSLVVEAVLPATQRPMRELARVAEVGQAARHAFFFVSHDDALNESGFAAETGAGGPVLLRKEPQRDFDERFVVIADARFSALLASVRYHGEAGAEASGDEVIWTFEPDIIYSALEYLMARVTAEQPAHASVFSEAVRTCVPKTMSLGLTVAVTTKLARFLQEQAMREIAVNRIAASIRRSLDLPSVLQTTVNEVGRALGAEYSALSVAVEHGATPLTTCYFRNAGDDDEACRARMMSDLDTYGVSMRAHPQVFFRDKSGKADGADARPLAAVPLIYGERATGVLMVWANDPARIWQENEILLMCTVADQVAVAVNHARLFQESQQHALTDALTGCFNRRAFEIQLERDLHLAMRMSQPVSLVLIDVDHFKRVNDEHGHDAGDAALRTIADALRDELR